MNLPAQSCPSPRPPLRRQASASPRLLRSLAVMTLLASMVWIGGCTNELDETENKLVVEKASGPCGACLAVGTKYRFTALKITELAGAQASLVQSLNGLWAKDIAKAELNIVLEITEVNAERVIFKVLNGARTLTECTDGVCCANGVCKGDEFCIMPETEAVMEQPITDAGLGESKETTLAVYAGSQASPKNCAPGAKLHAIPVGRVIATAGCSGTCEPASEDKISGKVTGVIDEVALKAGCTCLDLGNGLSDDVCGALDESYAGDDGGCAGCGKKWTNLGGLITSLNGSDLTYDCETEDGKSGACVIAEFDAVRLEADPPTCP